MSQRNLFISRKCPHCKRLLIGIHKYDFLRSQFYIIDIETNQFPDYVQTVPTLVVDQHMIKNDDVFGYLNNMVEQIFRQNPELKHKYSTDTPKPAVQQSIGATPTKVEKGPSHDPIDDIIGWCPDGGCEFSMISETNDDCSKKMVSLEDTRFSFISETDDQLSAPQPNKIPLETTNQQFQKSEKQQRMDESYERLMAERNLLK
jgi:hypothetical protein